MIGDGTEKGMTTAVDEQGLDLSRIEQLSRLTSEVTKDYAEGRVTWSQLRDRLGVVDFSAVLQRIGEEGLHLPQAAKDRPTQARAWMRQILAGRERAA